MPRRSRFSMVLCGLIAAGALAVVIGAAKGDSSAQVVRVVEKNQGFLPFADAPINYRSSDLKDPVANLEKRLERGELKLRYDSRHGYLKSVLDALHIAVSSQTLVFSRTSFQFPDISPSAPRALYYNDDVYVGQVHNGRFLEFVSFDPMQGAIFYVMDERRDQHPRFERAEVDCIQCHVAGSTKGIPGVMLRSVFTKPDGTADGAARSFVTGQESPLNQRWGGWYVTAKSGSQGAMANALISDPQHPEQLDRAAGANIESLTGRFDTAAYLAGSSDIVALMVLAHQTQMHNWITLTNYQTRIALFAESGSQTRLARDLKHRRSSWCDICFSLTKFLCRIRSREHPISRRQFVARGPRDSQGRSLRDFDLQKRIFKYPCSYLIYSEAFDAIPAPAKDYIYRRLFDILSGREQGPEFASLSSQDRRAILEILVATKPGLPDEWKRFVRDANQGLSSRARVGAVNLQPY